jgi:pyridoxamine 5'-phosphate oxidase
MSSIADLRKDYTLRGLSEADVASDPFVQFERWFAETREAGVVEPNAMTLATVSAEGQPSARVVLLKGFDRRGFVFYTNFASRKGQELTAHPLAALLFYWPELERQIRVEGVVERVADVEADSYFTSRPLGSRLGAWASPQSQVIADRAALDARLADVTARFGDEVPRPPHWGGLRVVPQRFEFWQGRPSRLHDRIVYVASEENWAINRLAP